MTRAEREYDKKAKAEFKRKYGAKTREKTKKAKRSKKARRQWWNSLTPEKQAECIEYWVKDKEEKRRQYSINYMESLGISRDCTKCVHESGCDTLPRGCEHYYNPLDSHKLKRTIRIVKCRDGLKAEVA
jgi:hypothetical protein